MTPSTSAATLAALGTIAALAGPARANDASFLGDGATVFAVKERRIAMVRESVTIRYDESARDHSRRWVAECVFTFRNTTDEPVEVQIGFPDWRGFGDASDGDAWAIRDFEVRVGGARVAATHKAIGSRDEAVRAGLPDPVALGYEAAYTWKVSFAPGQTVVVENRYRFGGLLSNGPMSGCTYDEPAAQLADVFWRKAGRAGAARWDFEDSVCRSVTYIVTTAKTWAGPVGEAEIAIQIPPDIWPHLVIPLPTAARIEPGWVRWKFRNFTPDREIKLVMAWPIPSEEVHLPLFDTPEQARAWVAFARNNGVTPAVVRQLCQAYRVRHGARARGRLAALLAAWPRPEEDGGGESARRSTKMTKAERAILAVLAAFERELARAARPGPGVRSVAEPERR